MLALLAIAALSTLAVQDAATEAPASQPNEVIEASTTPAPPPTDATTLIAQFDAQYAAWGDLIAELAARKARERYLAELLLPVITRPNLDEGASGEILRETRDTIAEVETADTHWALAQLEPERFAAFQLAQPRLANDILRWAERDEAGRGRIVAALEPVVLAGRYDPQAFAEMADTLALSQSRPQIYGTAAVCVDGQREPAPVRAPDNLDARRIALGLGPMADAWAALIAAQGEACEVSPSP
ncbi:DUF6624 domain-containing protein [uncultured Maricaulis sp.]|uniref:DUF6624 domain-containing protein n=1 Tax=uncultured Maricaulis sp. TaxID=174710 RepID=UPI0030DCACAB